MADQPVAKDKPAKDNPEAAALTRADAELRIEIAKIAFREIVNWQVAERKAGQEDVAASWAFRYADRFMDQSKKRPSFAAYNAKGVPGVTEEPIVEVQ